MKRGVTRWKRATGGRERIEQLRVMPAKCHMSWSSRYDAADQHTTKTSSEHTNAGPPPVPLLLLTPLVLCNW